MSAYYPGVLTPNPGSYVLTEFDCIWVTLGPNSMAGLDSEADLQRLGLERFHWTSIPGGTVDYLL